MRDLIKIKELSNKYDITARTLRYYEDMGLISSTRSSDYAYRLYDENAVKRLEQILILRKLNISIKDIQRVFSASGSEVVLDVLSSKVQNIDDEVALLHELKEIVLDFIRYIEQADFNKKSDVKLLHDKAKDIEGRIVNVEYNGNPFENSIIDRLLENAEKRGKKALNCRIINMRPMRVLSTYLKDTKRTENFHKGEGAEEIWNEEYKKILSKYEEMTGSRFNGYYGEGFEGHSDAGHILTRKIPDDCVNDSPYEDYILGGLFIAETTRPDLDPGELWDAMKEALAESSDFEIDDIYNGGQRDPIYGCQGGDLLNHSGFAYWECYIPVRKK
jgi:DNA-binding transcriptional MerR regulator